MRRSHLLSLLASASALALAAPAFAADAPTPPSTTVQEVIVTAEKKAEPLKEVPMSVTALAGPKLDELGVKDFADYAALVPGLSVESSGPGITRLTLRGQNAGSDGSNVAIYVDESPIGSSNALINGSILTGDMDTYDLQRIEVLRGPQGTLYGANSEGGLIKYVYNQPVLGAYQGGLEAMAEGVSHGNQGGSLDGMVNIPLGANAALRISGFDDYIPGYISDPLNGQKYVNSARKDGVRASLLFKPSDDLTIRLSADAQRTDVNGSSIVDIFNDTTRTFYGGSYTQEQLLRQPDNFVYENYNATIDWKLGWATLTSSSSYGILNTDQTADATNAIASGPTSGPPPTAAVTYPDALFGGDSVLTVGLHNDSVLDKFTQEVRLASNSSGNLDWIAGGYYTREEGALHQNIFVGDVSTGRQDPSFPLLEVVTLDSIYQEWAGFGDVTYHFNPQFSVQAGARYSHNTQSGTEVIGGPLACGSSINCVSFTTPSSGDVFTWSIAPKWQVDANTMIYARAATGFRPGGPNPLPPSAPQTVPREFGADSTTNYEAGIRSTLLDGKLSLDLAAFYVSWKNIQLVVDIDGFGIDGNGGTARTDGLEWAVDYVPIQGLTFAWTGALTEANLTSDAPGVDGVNGDRLPFVPRFSTTLDAEYAWEITDNFKGFVGATWAYVGDRAGDFESADFVESAHVPSDDAFVGQAKVPSYNTLAARVGVQNGQWRFELWGKNILGSKGMSSYGDGYPGFPGAMVLIPPPTVGLTISAKFQ